MDRVISNRKKSAKYYRSHKERIIITRRQAYEDHKEYARKKRALIKNKSYLSLDTIQPEEIHVA